MPLLRGRGGGGHKGVFMYTLVNGVKYTNFLIVKAPIASQVVIGTPGKVFDLASRRLLELRKIKVLVLDEADVMIDTQGLGNQSKRIAAYVPTFTFTITSKSLMHFTIYIRPPPPQKDFATLPNLRQMFSSHP